MFVQPDMHWLTKGEKHACYCIYLYVHAKFMGSTEHSLHAESLSDVAKSLSNSEDFLYAVIVMFTLALLRLPYHVLHSLCTPSMSPPSMYKFPWTFETEFAYVHVCCIAFAYIHVCSITCCTHCFPLMCFPFMSVCYEPFEAKTNLTKPEKLVRLWKPRKRCFTDETSIAAREEVKFKEACERWVDIKHKDRSLLVCACLMTV